MSSNLERYILCHKATDPKKKFEIAPALIEITNAALLGSYTYQDFAGEKETDVLEMSQNSKKQ